MVKRLRPKPSRPPPTRELTTLRSRLAELEEALRAIRTGEVDAVLAAGENGSQVFSLNGAEHAYRVLIESMNEGALMLTPDKTILYVNDCFARMVKLPLEQVTGGSFRRFLSADGRKSLRPLLKRDGTTGSKIHAVLNAGDGSRVPVQISVRPLARNGFAGRTIGMVVTDMTEAQRSEDRLRALSHRLVQVQEAERGRVALELDDNITQLLCSILVRSQALADRIPADDRASKRAAIELREMLGTAADDVERIARNLRPGVLDQLGLIAVLRATSTEFADRTGVAVKMAFVDRAVRLRADSELTLYRILQEALKNVELHARARNVTVRLKTQGAFAQLAIHDDGIGFGPNRSKAGLDGKTDLGLLGMRERATYVGGTLKIKSARRAGTEIEVRVPLAPRATRPSRSKES
jgi:two-component system NarL family sensor kinase